MTEQAFPPRPARPRRAAGCTLPPVVDRGRPAGKEGRELLKNAVEYQRKAEDCRQRAKRAVHPDDRAGWLHAAEDWQKLARCAEQLAEQCGLAAALSAVHDTVTETSNVDH